MQVAKKAVIYWIYIQALSMPATYLRPVRSPEPEPCPSMLVFNRLQKEPRRSGRTKGSLNRARVRGRRMGGWRLVPMQHRALYA